MSVDELAPSTGAPPPSHSTPPLAKPDGGSGSPADPAAGDEPGAPGGQEQDTVLTDVHAGEGISIEHSIFNGDVYHYTEVRRRAGLRQCSFSDDGRVVTEIEEQRAEVHFSGMEAEADALVRLLEERRVLLLTGEAGARKVTAATHLALRLRERGLCRRRAFVFDPVGRHVRVDVRGMPLKHDEFRDRVVIFRYGLSRGNPDLARALATTDRAGWTQLVECLRQRDAFLVVTATPTEAEPFRDVHALREMRRTLPAHPPEVKARRLDEYLSDLRRGGAAAESLDALGTSRGWLVERFAFAPQLADFVDFFLGLGEPSLGMDQAHTLFRDTRKRLLHDLDDDFDGWSFGFALTLAQCVPDAGGVPWVDFDRLRRHLLLWLRRDLQLTGGPREGGEEVEPSEVRLELSDDTLLTRSRARVDKDTATLADMVYFCDGRAPDGEWRMLLGHHRRVLTAILPRLRDLAERTGPDALSLSVLAAQIIGRIGELDYERVVVPMADRWAGLANGRYRGLIGAMFEGVLGSGDERFRTRCLQYLRVMQASSDTRPGKDRVQGAIAGYAWVGWYDFPLAMRELYAIVRAHLVPMIEDATRMSRLVAKLQKDIQQAARRGQDRQVRELQEVLRSLVDRIYAERGGIFLGVQFALVSFCAAHGVTPVLRELREWMARGGASTGVLVALMFMHERGIANQLRDNRGEIPQGDGLPPAACGQFVRALASGEEDVLQAVRFLGDLYDSVTSPWAAEALVRRHFRERLQACLLEWVEEGLTAPELERPVRGLLEQLSRTHQRKLHEIIVHLLNSGEFLRNPELRTFAASLQL